MTLNILLVRQQSNPAIETIKQLKHVLGFLVYSWILLKHKTGERQTGDSRNELLARVPDFARFSNKFTSIADLYSNQLPRLQMPWN